MSFLQRVSLLSWYIVDFPSVYQPEVGIDTFCIEGQASAVRVFSLLLEKMLLLSLVSDSLLCAVIEGRSFLTPSYSVEVLTFFF